MENHGVKARIAELRAENHELTRMTKADKLRLLEDIAKSNDAKTCDRIAAIKTHNEMLGDNLPAKHEISTGPNMLQQLEERAKFLVSSLNRAGCAEV